MKFLQKKLLPILLVAVVLFSLVGCAPQTEYSLVYDKQGQSVLVDDFSLSLMHLVIEDAEGTKTVPVTADMLDKPDLDALQTAGTHTVTVYYLTQKFSVTVTLEAKETNSWDGLVFASSSESYYQSAFGKTGSELKTALRSIISVVTNPTSYGDLRTLLAQTDKGSHNGTIRGFYSHEEFSATWDSGTTWNREHVWPTSKGWWGKTNNGDVNAGTDIHHIRPELTKGNSSRANLPFGTAGGSTSFNPPDESKGDVARVIMYMLVRYSETDTNYPVTKVVYTNNGTAKSAMELLLSWNENDPVDSYEITRNNEAYKIQGNRNPFIDCAQLANLIWE